jgi:hypothetical protein
MSCEIQEPIESYPLKLDDLEVGEIFEMYNYTGVYRVVRLPEEYDLGPTRIPLMQEIELSRANGHEPKIIHISQDGDGIHRPIVGEEGKVFFMAGTKPVRTVEPEAMIEAMTEARKSRRRVQWLTDEVVHQTGCTIEEIETCMRAPARMPVVNKRMGDVHRARFQAESERDAALKVIEQWAVERIWTRAKIEDALKALRHAQPADDDAFVLQVLVDKIVQILERH